MKKCKIPIEPRIDLLDTEYTDKMNKLRKWTNIATIGIIIGLGFIGLIYLYFKYLM